MEDPNNVVESTQSDDDGDLPPGQSSTVILEEPTSEMIEEISTYFEASQCMLGNSSEESLVTAAESESIEHPILTQVPVSRARRYRRSTRSEATTASEESGGGSASSASQPARSSARRKNLKGRNKWAFQAFRSPFFEGNSFNTTLPSLKRSLFSNIQQEAKVKTYAVGGFFKCIRLWHRVNEKRYVRATCLPALYLDADESLSPLSEGNETSDEEGIKVVSSDFFVQSRKGQCPQGTKDHIHANTVTQTKRSQTAVVVRGNDSLPDNAQTESLSKKGRTSSRTKGVRGRCTRPAEEPGSQGKTGRTSDRAKGVRGLGPQPVDGTGSLATLRRTSPRAKGVRGLGPQPVDETGSHDKNGPSSPPHPAPSGEEGSTASSQPEDHLGFKPAAGNGAVLEESSGLVSQKDPTPGVTPVQRVTPPPEVPCKGAAVSAGNRQPDVVRASVCRGPGPSKTKTRETNESREIISESVEVALECVPDEHVNDTDEQHRKRKGRKKEKGGKVKEEEEINISLDGPGPALASHPTSGSDMNIINNDQSLNPLGDQLEDLWRRKKMSKKKKPSTDGVITDGEVKVVDTASTGETSTPTEPTAVGFKKQKRKKLVPCSDDPEPIPEAGNTEAGNTEAGNTEVGNPFKHPADKGVAMEDDASETSDNSQRTLGSAMSIKNDGFDEERRRKRKKKEKKRKKEDKELGMSLDGTYPALDTSDISQSGSAMTINNNDDDEEHRKRKKRKKEKKLRFPEEEEMNVSFDGPCPAVETLDVSQGTSESGTNNNNNDGDDEHRKRKKRKKENKHKVASGEEINLSLDGPCPAIETSGVSQKTSESTMTINSNHSLDCSVDQLDDILKPRKKSSKKKKLRTNSGVTEEQVNVLDMASSHETSTLAETTAGFKKGKSKKDMFAPCREDPETKHRESEQSSCKPPADGEVECQRKKRRKRKMSETTRRAICEDTLVEGSGLTSACEKTRKRRHSFLSDDTMENHPKTNLSATGLDNHRQNDKSTDERISTCDVDTEPVENGETLMDSLIVKTKKKKKRERDASRVNEECEGSVLDVRSSAVTGDDTVRRRKKKKKMKDKADRESESPVVVDRETPDDIQTTVLIKKKKKKCKKSTRPPSQGSTPTEARAESGAPTTPDCVTFSPRRCSPAVDTDATHAGNAAIPNDGATAKKKAGKKREKNTSAVGTCDSDAAEQNTRATTEPLQHRPTETESRLKNKKRAGRVTNRTEAATDPGAPEAQHAGHEAEVASQRDAALPERRTRMHHESGSPRRDKKKARKRKSLFNQGRDFLDTESILA